MSDEKRQTISDEMIYEVSEAEYDSVSAGGLFNVSGLIRRIEHIEDILHERGIHQTRVAIQISRQVQVNTVNVGHTAGNQVRVQTISQVNRVVI
jgi:hypothetical protein